MGTGTRTYAWRGPGCRTPVLGKPHIPTPHSPPLLTDPHLPGNRTPTEAQGRGLPSPERKHLEFYSKYNRKTAEERKQGDLIAVTV